jgi:hypothetical protein
MARTLQLLAPSGRTLSVRLVASTDVIAETIAMTERTNALGVYGGTLTAAAGTYTAVVIDSVDGVLGTFEAVEVTGDANETAIVRDIVNPSDTAALLAAISAITGGEGGAFSLSVTVEDSDENPLQNVTVQILDGSIVIDRGLTDENGEVSLTADAGTYTITASRPGLYASHTATLVVTGHATVPTITLGSITIPASPAANQVTCWAYVYDSDGQLAAGVTCTLQVAVADPADEGRIYSGAAREVVSDANGLVAWPGVPEKARIRYWGGGANDEFKKVRTLTLLAANVEAGAYELPSIVAAE